MTIATARTWTAVSTTVLLLLLLVGCLQLTGQRICLRHDDGGDRLQLLISYDGVHDSGKGRRNRTEQMLRDFVADGDFMLFDWFGHVQREGIRAAVRRQDAPLHDALCELFTDRLQVTQLGHYRDPDGRIGAAQLVVIEQISAVIAAANAALSEAITAEESVLDDESWSRTLPRWKAAAAAGHEWIALQGHALVFRFPVDAAEWTRAKFGLFAELGRAGLDPVDRAFLQRWLATVPLSVTQHADRVELRLGDPDAPTAMRCQWRDDYLPNLEEVVVEAVPASLDQALASHLLQRGPPADGIQDLVAWGLPEEQVRAVVGAARGDDARQRVRALAWLEEFGERWNQAGSTPEAPGVGADRAAYLAGWDGWYRALLTEPRPQ